MKCKHNWHLVRVYFESPFREPFTEKRVATFICSECGLLKKIDVKYE